MPNYLMDAERPGKRQQSILETNPSPSPFASSKSGATDELLATCEQQRASNREAALNYGGSLSDDTLPDKQLMNEEKLQQYLQSTNTEDAPLDYQEPYKAPIGPIQVLKIRNKAYF